jgi:hypothetical protein
MLIKNYLKKGRNSLGTDFPVESKSYVDLHAAVARKIVKAIQVKDSPENALTREETLRE